MLRLKFYKMTNHKHYMKTAPANFCLMLITNVSLLIVSCVFVQCANDHPTDESANISYPWPNEGIAYVFPFNENVKISGVECNYIVQDFLYKGFLNVAIARTKEIDTEKQIETAKYIHSLLYHNDLIYNEPAAKARVRNIYQRLTPHLKDFDFKIFLIQNFSSCAFITIGNYIYLDWDFFKHKSDDLIAFVIAHEIGVTSNQ